MYGVFLLLFFLFGLIIGVFFGRGVFFTFGLIIGCCFGFWLDFWLLICFCLRCLDGQGWRGGLDMRQAFPIRQAGLARRSSSHESTFNSSGHNQQAVVVIGGRPM